MKLEDKIKNLILIISKSAVKRNDCPISERLLGLILDSITNNQKIINEIIFQLRNSVEYINAKHTSNFKISLSSKDRSIFKYVNIFPDHIKDVGDKYIIWFSNFLQNNMEERDMHFVWKYLNSIYCDL